MYNEFLDTGSRVYEGKCAVVTNLLCSPTTHLPIRHIEVSSNYSRYWGIDGICLIPSGQTYAGLYMSITNKWLICEMKLYSAVRVL